MPETVQQVMAMVEKVMENPERLVLVIGQPGSGKSRLLRELASLEGWKLVNCRELISEELLELTPNVRQQEAPVIIGDTLARWDAKVILLDNVDVLFTPVLHLQPVELIRQLSRQQLIVAAWPGSCDGTNLKFIHSLAQKAYNFPVNDLSIFTID